MTTLFLNPQRVAAGSQAAKAEAAIAFHAKLLQKILQIDDDVRKQIREKLEALAKSTEVPRKIPVCAKHTIHREIPAYLKSDTFKALKHELATTGWILRKPKTNDIMSDDDFETRWISSHVHFDLVPCH